MFEKLLVPLDGSRIAEMALPYARLWGDAWVRMGVLKKIFNKGENNDNKTRNQRGRDRVGYWNSSTAIVGR
ncbi:MAG TPA: hypothetical protein VEI95_00420 [Acidobacteriota bacterium]|nr:hypothetical protein [Acidobacteriota bacterium]